MFFHNFLYYCGSEGKELVMGLIGRLITSVYRYVRYGRQIGKTAANGTKLYGRGKINRTAIDAHGNVTRTIRNKGYDAASHTQCSQITDYYSNGAKKAEARLNTTYQGDGTISRYMSRSFFDRYGLSNSYGASKAGANKAWHRTVDYNPDIKELRSCVDTYTPDGYGSVRRELNVKM